jgi:amino acid transporter
MAGVLLVFQIGQPRIWMAMSRDGLLPKVFSAIHPKYKTPWFSTLVTGAVVAIPSLFMNLTEVTDLTSIGTLFAFLLVCGGVLILDHKHPTYKRGFKVPYINSQWLMPVLSLLVIALLIGFNRDGVHAFFTYGDWETFRHKIPTFGYLAGMLALNTLCVRFRLSLIPCLGLATCGYLISELGYHNWVRFLAWLAVGMLVYFGYGFKQSKLNQTPTP